MKEKIRKFLHSGIASMRFSGAVSIFALTTVLAVPTMLHSQQDVGTIGGTVADPVGNLVSKAKVTISNDATGLKYEAVTNDSGFYQSQALPPGRYTVTISASGFSIFATRNVVVDAAAHVTTNAQLQVGTVESSIVVESTPPALNMVDAQIESKLRPKDRPPWRGR